MGEAQFHTWEAAASSALDWWHDAGVDTLVDDAPRDWLAPVPRADAIPIVRAAAVPTAGEPSSYAAFWDWRLDAGAPERDWGVPILPPEGPRDADFLIIIDQANGDSLIEGVEGAMLDRILSSIGRSRSDVCIASLAHARPLADTLPSDAIGELAARASLLLRLTPARTALMIGHTTARALSATNDAPAVHAFHGINRNDKELRVGAIAHPRFMLKHPQVKRDAWKCLRSLIGGNAL